jgi:acetyl esterase/lipase
MRAGSGAPFWRRASFSRWAALLVLTGFLTTACTRVELLVANFPALFGPFTRHANLAYGTLPQQRLDVYVPDQPRSDALPIVVFWHGGRWEYGDKRDYRFVGAALAGLGYVAVLPDYRHYPEVKLEGFMEDAARAVNWTVMHAAEYHADPRRLYLMGHSSGAHMAVLLALDSRYFKAVGAAVPPIAGVIGLSGPYDFLPLTDADLQDMFGPPERYEDSQPIHFVGPGAPPMLLVDGEADRDVLPKNTRNLAAALRAHDDRVTLLMYPKLGHADTVAALSAPARGRAPVLAAIAEFIGKP